MMRRGLGASIAPLHPNRAGRLLLWMAALPACRGPQRMLDARGPAADQIATLWWVILAMAIVTSVAVSGLLLLAIRQAARRDSGVAAREVDGRRLVWIGAVIVPALMLFTALVASYRLSNEVYPPRTAPADALTIEIIGHQFWWEIRYPDHGVVTANEFHIPAGAPVRLLVTSRDVNHSFWLPQLQGKIDMIPGRTHEWWFTADSAGSFRGQCAEYCGLSHALMAFWVTAVDPVEFQEWLAHRVQRTETAAPPRATGTVDAPGPAPHREDPDLQDADAPDRQGADRPTENSQVTQGRAVFLEASCSQCHATPDAPLPQQLRGTAPDLGDFGTRRTIGAGRLPNTPENLAAWVTNPQRLKPGARMPPTGLSAEEMNALVAYLYSLR